MFYSECCLKKILSVYFICILLKQHLEMKKRLNLIGRLVLWLQVKLPMEPQHQLQTDPQTELYTDETQKNNITNKSDADCSDVADSTASVDAQKNNGWYI